MQFWTVKKELLVVLLTPREIDGRFDAVHEQLAYAFAVAIGSNGKLDFVPLLALDGLIARRNLCSVFRFPLGAIAVQSLAIGDRSVELPG